MTDKSPLFVSALELLAHGTELYSMGHPNKYKFVILHLANSIELILKDCLIDHNVSIYKGPKETITIWGTFDELNKLGIVIPEKPVIELLIDDRNTIQHRFGFPNGEAVFYYLEQVASFFVRFLEEQYKVKLTEALEPHLSKENLALIGLIPDDYSHLKKLYQISPEAAIQQAYSAIEKKLRKEVPMSELRQRADGSKASSQFIPALLRDQIRILVEEGYINADIANDIELLRNTRNRVAHSSGDTDGNSKELEKVFKIALRILSVLEQVNRSNQEKTPEDQKAG